MRGCFGGCSFCSITEHEGRIIQSRSEESILEEIEDIRDKVPGFTGVISDESGVPLPGVNVVIKGTNTGTTTDFNGNYSINASDTDILTFSFVGFIDQEIEVGNADSFNLSLQMGSDELDEVVLTGYGTTKRANLTNSVSKLNTESLVDRPIMTLGEAFSGQLAGVYAQQSSGLPGSEFNIKVRGCLLYTSPSPRDS